MSNLKMNHVLTVSVFHSNGSATSEDLFWKLDALQMFVMDLHWPEPEFAKHLEQRLKLMASDMMEACVKRSAILWLYMYILYDCYDCKGLYKCLIHSLIHSFRELINGCPCTARSFMSLISLSSLISRTKAAFDSKMQKSSKSTDFRVPLSVCTMFNVLMDAKKQCSKLCVLDQGQEVRYYPARALCSDTSMFLSQYCRCLMNTISLVKTSGLCSTDSKEVITRLRTLNYVTLISHLNSCQTGKDPSVSLFIPQTFWVELAQVLLVGVKCFVISVGDIITSSSSA